MEILVYYLTLPQCPDSAYLPRILKSPRIKNFYTKSIGKHRSLTWFTANGGPSEGVLCLSVDTKYATLELFILPSQTLGDTLSRIPCDEGMFRSASIFFNHIMGLHNKISIDDCCPHKLEDPKPVKKFDFEEYDKWADIKIRNKGEVEVYVGNCIMTLVSPDR